MTYFWFSSLSTVGLGDYHPVSDVERVAGAILLLGGVTVTSYILENLMTMINRLRVLNKDHEETDRLSEFIGTLERFNGREKLNPELNDSIICYFSYRWQQNKN